MVIVTQKISLVTKLDSLVNFFSIFGIFAFVCNFGVAAGALRIGQDKFDLRSP